MCRHSFEELKVNIFARIILELLDAEKQNLRINRIFIEFQLMDASRNERCSGLREGDDKKLL